jgi:hypothetical protein
VIDAPTLLGTQVLGWNGAEVTLQSVDGTLFRRTPRHLELIEASNEQSETEIVVGARVRIRADEGSRRAGRVISITLGGTHASVEMDTGSVAMFTVTQLVRIP